MRCGNSLSHLILPYGFGVRQDMGLNNGTWTAAGKGWRKAGTAEIISENGSYAEFVSTGGEYVWFSETASQDAKLTIESKTVYSADNTFTLDFVLENTELIKSVSLSDFTLNSSVFEIIGGEWKVANTEINDWDAANQIGAAAYPAENGGAYLFFSADIQYAADDLVALVHTYVYRIFILSVIHIGSILSCLNYNRNISILLRTVG